MKRSPAIIAVALGLTAATAGAAEPDDIGPYAVDVEDYDFGDEAFQPSAFPSVELAGRVYSPADLEDGPFPFVLLLHGWHATCYDPANPGGTPGDGSYNGGFWIWPCPEPMVSVPSFQGYDYLGELLASHGFVVVSVSANGIAGHDNDDPDYGMQARADLLDEHLERWASWNDIGGDPFGDKFVGAIDLERVGAMGHSRGGEGVATWAARDRAAGTNRVDAALLLAPVEFWRPLVTNVTLGVVLPYCDGDVYTLEGAHYFDDARYATPGDATPKYTFVMDGSNHNYYNTIWSPDVFVAGAGDDAVFLEPFFGADPYCGSRGMGRITETEQRDSLAAYGAAFFRTHLGGEVEFEPVLRGDVIPMSAAPAAARVAYLAPDDPTQRLDVNHLDSDPALQSNDLDGAVEVSDAPRYELCGLGDHPQTDPCVDEVGIYMGYIYEGRQPHTPGLGELRIAMAEGGSWTNRLPAGTDVSELAVLQFRVTPDFESMLTGGDIVVSLADGGGNSASVTVAEYSSAVEPYPGSVWPIYPKKVLSAVRIPLSAFEGVELTDVESITLSAVGGPVSMLLSDLAFTDPFTDEDPSSTGSTDGTSGTSGTESSGSTGDTAATGDTTGNVTTEASSESGTDTDMPGQSGDAGCGCSLPRKPPLLLVLLCLPLWRRRRRADRRSAPRALRRP